MRRFQDILASKRSNPCHIRPLDESRECVAQAFALLHRPAPGTNPFVVVQSVELEIAAVDQLAEVSDPRGALNATALGADSFFYCA
jgi:hypothetical protein